MPLTVTVKKQQLRGGNPSTHTIKNDGRTATDFYMLLCNQVPANIKAVYTAAITSGLPTVGTAYDAGDVTDARYCNSVDIKSTGNEVQFIAQVDYQTNPASGLDFIPNPLLRKDVIKFSASKEQEAVFLTEETTPKPIVNSAGETFRTLPTRTTGSFKLTISGNRAVSGTGSIPVATVASYLRPNSVNDASVTIRGITLNIGQAKLVGASFTIETDQIYGAYAAWEWELECAPDWQLHLDDRGFNSLTTDIAGFNVTFPIVKGDPSEQVQTPWPLDGSGNAKDNVDDVPATLDFPIQPKKDFSVFNWTTAA